MALDLRRRQSLTRVRRIRLLAAEVDELPALREDIASHEFPLAALFFAVCDRGVFLLPGASEGEKREWRQQGEAHRFHRFVAK
ncbi:hypothetical protein HZ994_16570 [Akkermansiaceae bacterium]|nr:hypothetical protein HZ994_16570 [Akkermansiaceae bacterium]